MSCFGFVEHDRKKLFTEYKQYLLLKGLLFIDETFLNRLISGSTRSFLWIGDHFFACSVLPFLEVVLHYLYQVTKTCCIMCIGLYVFPMRPRMNIMKLK